MADRLGSEYGIIPASLSASDGICLSIAGEPVTPEHITEWTGMIDGGVIDKETFLHARRNLEMLLDAANRKGRGVRFVAALNQWMEQTLVSMNLSGAIEEIYQEHTVVVPEQKATIANLNQFFLKLNFPGWRKFTDSCQLNDVATMTERITPKWVPIFGGGDYTDPVTRGPRRGVYLSGKTNRINIVVKAGRKIYSAPEFERNQLQMISPKIAATALVTEPVSEKRSSRGRSRKTSSRPAE